MIETTLEPTDEFAATARNSAQALHTFKERSAAQIEKKIEEGELVGPDIERAQQGRERAIVKLRDMLALELAVKFEFDQDIQFPDGNVALERGRELLDSHANEAAFDTLEA